MKHLGKRSIIRKTAEIGASTALSRLLGLIRELLFNKYLGATPLAEAFLAAFKIPNFLRKVFAEGALSGALVPIFVKVSKKDQGDLSRLVSQVLLFFEFFVLIICAVVLLFPKIVLFLVAPGFGEQQQELTIPLLRILIFFIFFISSSAVISSALQAAHHFQVPAWGQVLLNITFIGGLLSCITYKLTVQYLCYAILLGATIHSVLHVLVYFRYGFYFGKINRETWQLFKPILFNVLPTLLVVGIMEINTWIDGMFASYMKGSIALIHYGSAFMRIPLGVFGVAFSTILLPHFSRIRLYAPKRLNFYLFEGAKLIFFVTIPTMLLMIFFSKKIFLTLFLSDKFMMKDVIEAQYILIGFLIGLFFFSLNRIILNVYYAYHDLLTPTFISLFVTGANILLNWILIGSLYAPGLALATSISGALQSILYVFFLRKMFSIKFYLSEFLLFVFRFTGLVACFSILFYAFYRLVEYLLVSMVPVRSIDFLFYGFGFWIWSLPLAGIVGLGMLFTRRWFGIKLYFLD